MFYCTFLNVTSAQNIEIIDNSFNAFFFKDSNNIWVSSQGGWNRDDGCHTYQYITNDSLSGLNGEWIQSGMFPDKDGLLWTSTYEELCFFDYEKDIFECFEISHHGVKVRENIKVVAYIENNHYLIIRAGDELFKFNIEDNSLDPLIDGETTNGQNYLIDESTGSFTIYACPWITNQELEIWTYNKNIWTKRVTDFSECTFLKDVIVTSATIVDEQLWLCTNLGLVLYDNKKPCQSILYKYNNEEYITSFAHYFEGYILITTDKHGLLAFDIDHLDYTNQLTKTDKEIPLLSNRPVEIFDSEENLILSYRGDGIQFLSKSFLRFRLLFDNISMRQTTKKIESTSSFVALSDRTSTISIYNNYELYDQIQVEFNGVLSDMIFTDKFLYFYDDYSIWEYNIESKKLKSLFSDNKVKLNKITAFENSIVVISTNNSYHLQNNDLIPFDIDEENAVVNCYRFNNNLQAVAKNNLVEINHNGRNVRIKTYSYIYAITYDSINNRLLLGLGKGLGLIDLDSLNFEIINIDNSRVDDLLAIDHNSYILNTSNGLYYLKDDLAYKRINHGSKILDMAIFKDYLLYTNSQGGNAIALDDLDHKKKVSISVESASYNRDETKNVITYSYSYSDLPLSLEIRSNDWQTNQTGYYSYQINSLNKKPIIQDFNDPINLPGLIEGDYQIEIQGYSSDLTKSDKLIINVDISGPFWRQWWFYLLSLFFLGSILYIYFRTKNKKIQEQHKIKNNISDLERAALQAQMNPHFIFNCLNSIQGFIMDNDKEQAMEYLGGFAQLIRSNLNASTSSKISLAEEHRILHNYLKLERLRLNQSFEYEIILPTQKDANDIMIPPMLIQPFVENAVIHGMRNGIKNGLIEIEFNLNGSTLNVEVSDNGDSSLPPINIPGHKSVGVDITRKRLNYINQSDQNIDNLSINHTSSGTTVNLSIQLD